MTSRSINAATATSIRPPDRNPKTAKNSGYGSPELTPRAREKQRLEKRTEMKVPAKTQDLMPRMTREQCYLCIMRKNEAPPKQTKTPDELRVDHHDYLLDLERRGILFGAGPFRDGDGWAADHGVGMVVVRARTARRQRQRPSRNPSPRLAGISWRSCPGYGMRGRLTSKSGSPTACFRLTVDVTGLANKTRNLKLRTDDGLGAPRPRKPSAPSSRCSEKMSRAGSRPLSRRRQAP